MPTTDNIDPAAEQVSAVDFINKFNSDIEGFEVELSMQVHQEPDGNVVYAGIGVMMARSDMPAFIPSDVLRKLADEADAMAQKAVDEANAGNRG
jgi:hypothetical protein